MLGGQYYVWEYHAINLSILDFKYVIIKSQQRQSNTINLSILDFKCLIASAIACCGVTINLSILDFKSILNSCFVFVSLSL